MTDETDGQTNRNALQNRDVEESPAIEVSVRAVDPFDDTGSDP